MIERFGGPFEFYRRFFLTAICPIGFTRHGKNINYYDDRKLLQTAKPFIVDTMKEQLALGAYRKTVICLGEGKNYEYLLKLNEEYHFFDEVVPLAHPRFIMQYKRKKLEWYIDTYLKTFGKAVEKNIHLT
jgi:hypothetical protein